MSERPTTYRVSVWNVVKHASRRRYGVRWKAEGREHSEWYATKALAESFRSDLQRAQRAGEAFEVQSGLPVSLARKRNARTLLEVATSYVDWLWASGAPPEHAEGRRDEHGSDRSAVRPATRSRARSGGSAARAVDAPAPAASSR